jgi:ABC-type multidrug transport system fused ATPase/permease subunit
MSIVLKILGFLNKKEKQRSLILFILILLTGIVDTLGIASIFPFISILSDPNLINTNQYLNFLSIKFDQFGITNYFPFTKIFGYGVLIFFTISISLRSITNYLQIRFVNMREYSLARRILNYYLNQKYSWFTRQSSSNLSRNILSEVAEFMDQSFMPLLNIIAYGILVILLLSVLFYTDPSTTLIISLIIPTSYSIFFILLKRILKKKGQTRFYSNKNRYKLLDEVFSGIKQVKISSQETYFSKLFSLYSYDYAKANSAAKAIALIPRFVVEAIAFGGLLILILIKIDEESFLSTLPIISLIAFAGYRILPAFQQIYIALTQLRYSNVIVDHMEQMFQKINEVKLVDKNLRENIVLKKSIQLNNVDFKYQNSNNLILDKINLVIPCKSKVGIIGPTGGGKTTLIDVIIGLLEPIKGQVLIDEIELNQKNKYGWYKQFGYIPQDTFLIDDNIYRNVAFGVEEDEINKKKVEEVCKIACLDDFINNDLPNNYNTIIGDRGIRLSGGQKQRISLARSLYNDPSILIMDEATSALDTETELEIINNINKLKNDITIIMIAHRYVTLSNCDIIIEIDKGKITRTGTYNELLKK